MTQLKDEDVAFEQRRQKILDERAKWTPEQRATHDKEYAEWAKEIMDAAPPPVHRMAVDALAEIVIAARNGKLKPDQIPDNVGELLFVTYMAISNNLAKQVLREMLNGRA